MKPIPSFTAAELGDIPFPPLDFVVDPIIAAGTATMLAGRPKCNKTWFSEDAGLSVAEGGFACGEWATAQGDVLYYALEDNQRRLKQRLEKLRPVGEWPHRLTFKLAAPALGDGFREDVEAWARSCDNPRLVIVDTYSLILPPRQRQSYLSDYADSALFTKIASELNIALLAIYHTRKCDADDALDAVSGTTGIAGGFDSVLVLRRAPEGGGFILEGRGRDIMPLEVGLDFDADTGKWSVLGDASTAFVSDERKAILDTLGDLGKAGPKEIAERINVPYDSVRKILGKMVDQGQVKKTGYGSYTPLHSGHTVHSSDASVNGVNSVTGVSEGPCPNCSGEGCHWCMA